MMDRVEFLKKLFDYLNQQIRYALLRNFEGLPEQNDSRDIDIAIAHKDYIRHRGELVRLVEESGWKSLRKGLAGGKSFAYRIRLIAVRHDEGITRGADGVVDDEGRIFHLALVIGIDGDFFALFDEHAVAAVLAPAHDEIGENRLFAVGALADDDASADVTVALDALADRGNGIDVHR